MSWDKVRSESMWFSGNIRDNRRESRKSSFHTKATSTRPTQANVTVPEKFMFYSSGKPNILSGKCWQKFHFCKLQISFQALTTSKIFFDALMYNLGSLLLSFAALMRPITSSSCFEHTFAYYFYNSKPDTSKRATTTGFIKCLSIERRKKNYKIIEHIKFLFFFSSSSFAAFSSLCFLMESLPIEYESIKK